MASLALATVWAACGGDGPPAPRPASSDSLDPQVTALVQETADAVDARPGDAELRGRLGMVYEANDLFSLAAQSYEQALASRPRDAKLWFRLAACREREGDLDGAVAALEESATHDAGNAPTHARLARWLLDLGDTDAAAQAAAEARSIDPESAEAWFATARVHLRQRQPQQAIEVIRGRGLTSGRNAPLAMHLLATARRMAGETPAAAPPSPSGRARATFADPWTREMAQFRTGVARQQARAGALLRRGDFPAALKVLEELRKSTPQDERILNMLAQCYLQLGAADKALAALDTALEARPQHFGSHLNTAKVALIAHQQGSASLDKALGHAERAIELRQHSGEAHAARASILLALGRPDEALDGTRQAWELDARNPSAMVRMGSWLIDNQRWTEAVEVFDSVLDVHPGQPLALLGLARAEMERGDFDDAEATLGRLPAGPENPAVAAAQARLQELRSAAGGAS